MSAGNPTFPPPKAPTGVPESGSNKGVEGKKTVQEGLGILSNRVREAVGDRRVIKIFHEGFGAKDWYTIHMAPDAVHHNLYIVDLENNGKVFSVKVPRDDPFNAMLKYHTEVDMDTGTEEWIYNFDGQSQVEVTDPKGTKQVMQLDGKERSLASLEAYLRSTMTKVSVGKEEYSG